MCWNLRVHENLSEVRMPATGRGTAQTKPRCPSSSETPWPGTRHCAAADCRPPLDLLLESSTADRNTTVCTGRRREHSDSRKKKGWKWKHICLKCGGIRLLRRKMGYWNTMQMAMLLLQEPEWGMDVILTVYAGTETASSWVFQHTQTAVAITTRGWGGATR